MLRDSMDYLANNHQRKRSFDLANNYQDVTSTIRRCVRHGSASTALPVGLLESSQIPASSSKRRPPLYPTKYSNMPPVEVGSIMSTPFPSFMSVVGKPDTSILKAMEELAAAPETIPESDTRILVTDANPPTDSTVQRSTLLLHHRDSITSMTSASTESSPTTTNSTFDSPLITDSSPSSSPESANSNAPVSPFRNIMVRPEQSTVPQQQTAPPTKEATTGPLPKPALVPELPKNVKNLSLNMSAVVLPRPSTAYGFESHAFSAPASPSKDTPRTGRKKPTNLTIRTPGFQQVTFNRALDVPPTPSSRPSLHHMASSPALASLASPTKPPPGGLFLHLPASGTVLSGSGTESNSSAQSANPQLPEVREEDEFRPQRSQETQEKGYPKGPVLIYDSGVYLYLEPTAQEASQFDMVINVAKEIKNPFEIGPPKLEMEPQTAISELSFKSAWEWPQPNEIPTPTTPRPNSFAQRPQPEYLHVPWDHNSEILEDLYCLCRLIDERVQAGKKVLIHCQLGVSRSASLVIAYGLYKGYQPDFHSMYMAVKQRSEWVGPNMSLIYQLTDFRSKVVKGVYGDHCNNPKPSWWKIPSSGSPIMDTPIAKQSSWLGERAPAQTGALVSEPYEKAPPPLRLDKALPPVPLFPREDKTNSEATPAKLSQILGSIAKQSLEPTKPSAPEPVTEVRNSPRPQSPPQSVSPRPLPFRERFDSPPPQQSPNPSKTPRLGIVTSSPRMDVAVEEPDEPSLLSPRATEFMVSPFGITTSADPGMTNGGGKNVTRGVLLPRQVQQPAPYSVAGQIPAPFDPRSPHQQGEAPEIFRNIDDFL
ncbi:uncharacterized protein Z520_03860 [Fonsecaea multimorphosa CBS 102226]|uniref:protein-tyrosine-phosphatase n=1 Tax=Fonsecaea multimorphosa CBS 102226 TaxID=1442371 RepID=A0A0D2KAH2_9EURO|nr:uncharacterized protein Z520_03860 [Fonsecaea multimorphosa CBS 102226]KIY00175.1 hypothetical protein Z520_03860 [Fonsecaea multimorphosa CBS 102226]OAL27371.1 hypothetical protein AYO22_03646 [Fonsecaea multimorphosa]